MNDLIIVGGGAAGLSAAMYALGKQLSFVTVYDTPGGKAGWRQQLSDQTREEFLPGSETVAQFKQILAAHPGHTLQDTVVAVERSPKGFQVESQHHGRLECRALIVATGAAPIPLNVPGAQELIGHGLGYSVTTHAHILKGKTVAVIGTTARALRGVAELSHTAAKIYLIAPDRTFAPPDWVLAPNIELLIGHQLQEVIGPRHVTELVLAHNGTQHHLGVDAIFADLGLRGNSSMVERLVATDHNGFILVDDHNITTQAGIFAAGDVTSAFGEQVLIAIGEGARAALSAYDYLLARKERLVGLTHDLPGD